MPDAKDNQLAQRLLDLARKENRLRVSGGGLEVRQDDGTWTQVAATGATVASQQTVRDRKTASRPTITGQIAILFRKAIGAGASPDSYEYWLQLGREQVKLASIPATLPACPSTDPDDGSNPDQTQPDRYPGLKDGKLYACHLVGAGQTGQTRHTVGGVPYPIKNGYNNLLVFPVDGSHAITPAGHFRRWESEFFPQDGFGQQGYGTSKVYNIGCGPQIAPGTAPVRFAGDIGNTYFPIPEAFAVPPDHLSWTTVGIILYDDPNGWQISHLEYHTHIEQGLVSPSYPDPGWERAQDGELRILYLAFKRTTDLESRPDSTFYENYDSYPCYQTPGYFDWQSVWNYQDPPSLDPGTQPPDPSADPRLPPGTRNNTAAVTLSAYRSTLFVTIRDLPRCGSPVSFGRLRCFEISNKEVMPKPNPDERDWRRSMILSDPTNVVFDPIQIDMIGLACFDSLVHNNFTHVQGNKAVRVGKVLTQPNPGDPDDLLDTDRTLSIEITTAQVQSEGGKCNLIRPVRSKLSVQGLGEREGERSVIGMVPLG
jgi:hypothetical protein